jgi:hypothetical protein
MGISINSVTLNPQDLKPQRIALTVTYNGFVDDDADNPVTVTMTVEDGTNVYVAENKTDEKKTLTWTDNLPVGSAGDKTKSGLYAGIDPADSGKSCNVAFHFQPATGGSGDDKQNHFNL